MRVFQIYCRGEYLKNGKTWLHCLFRGEFTVAVMLGTFNLEAPGSNIPRSIKISTSLSLPVHLDHYGILC
jgi:hypothetical protein